MTAVPPSKSSPWSWRGWWWSSLKALWSLMENRKFARKKKKNNLSTLNLLLQTKLYTLIIFKNVWVTFNIELMHEQEHVLGQLLKTYKTFVNFISWLLTLSQTTSSLKVTLHFIRLPETEEGSRKMRINIMSINLYKITLSINTCIWVTSDRFSSVMMVVYTSKCLFIPNSQITLLYIGHKIRNQWLGMCLSTSH